MKQLLVIIIILGLTVGLLSVIHFPVRMPDQGVSRNPIPTATLTPTPTPAPLPISKILPANYHIFQTFNNCGPASLSMLLSHYNISVSQKELGDSLRPYQIAGGNNDDKSVTIEELAEKAREYGLTPFHRPAGSIERIKQFLAHDIPVLTRTWTKHNEDIGHYRVVKGYDDKTGELIQDDSLQGKNLRYSYDEFNILWEKFSFEYLVLVPPEKVNVAKRILGPHADENKAWQDAAANARSKLSADPENTPYRFNLSVALYHIGNYEGSVYEFEKVEHSIPFRTLWYQIEPILAYYKLGRFDKVFSITNKVLDNHNKAYSELYLIRSEIFKKQGNAEAARAEYQKALQYNKNIEKYARKNVDL